MWKVSALRYLIQQNSLQNSWLVLWSVMLASAASSQLNRTQNFKELEILAFVPCTNATGTDLSSGTCDLYVYPAILQAIEDVNSNGILCQVTAPNDTCFRFRLFHAIQKTNPLEALIEYLKLQQSSGRALAGIVGPSTNEMTQLLAYSSDAGMPEAVVSFGATDIVFNTKKNLYPNLVRTIPSIDAGNRALLCLVRNFEWEKIVIATSSASLVHHRAAESIVSLAMRSGFTASLSKFPTMNEDGDFAKGFLDESHGRTASHVQGIFKSWILKNIQIIIVFQTSIETRSLFCQAKKMAESLLDDAHVWLLPHLLDPLWFHLEEEIIASLQRTQNCSNEEMVTILNNTNILHLDFMKYNVIQPPSWESFQSSYNLGQNVSNFIKEIRNEVNPELPHSPERMLHSLAGPAYDSVWALALAYHQELQLSQTLELSKVLFQINNLSFSGISKYHNFKSNQGQDFASVHLISQYYEGKLQPVALMSNLNPNLYNFCSTMNITSVGIESLDILNLLGIDSYLQDFVWTGGFQPSDEPNYFNFYVPASHMLIALVFQSVTIVVCSVMLLAMVKLWKNKHIRSMSPKFTLVAMIALLVRLPAGFFLALSFSALEYGINPRTQVAMCGLYTFLPLTADVVAQSIFLAKGWRIYKIFYNSRQKSKISRISDTYLCIIIGIFVVPFIIVTLVALIVGIHTTVIEDYNINSTTRVRVTYCKEASFSGAFTGPIYTELLILSVLMLFVAVRNASINDPRYSEEGKSIFRYGATSVILSTTYVVLLIVFIYMGSLYSILEVFWISTILCSVTPMLLYFAILSPKFEIIYGEYKEKKMKRKNDLFRRDTSMHLEELKLQCDNLKSSLNEKEKRIAALKEKSLELTRN